MMRWAALFSAWIAFAAPALAQDSAETGQMRLYVQQLEERVRQLTGENEQLLYQLNQLRAQAGQPGVPMAGAAVLPGAPSPASPGTQAGLEPAPGGLPSAAPGAPPQDIGTLSIDPNDPLISQDGAGDGAPIDLSTLAGGDPAQPQPDPALGIPVPAQPDPLQGQPTAALPGAPAPTAALSGSPRDEYDLAYGYVLTGEYALAEQSFQNWLAAFPEEAQAPDARFWLGESHYAQGEYREAATAFFAVYEAAPDSSKGPDALFKLGVSLAALGETKAACGTLAEVGRKYPQASAALMSRVNDEASRVGCS